MAAETGSLTVVTTLIAAGADVESRGGAVALHSVAAQHGHVEVLKAILEHGADVSADENEDTALHMASLCDENGAVDVLIEAGADVERKGERGTTPLMYAAAQASTRGCKTLRVLLRHGAHFETRDLCKGNTPLHIACRERWVGVDTAVDLLLRYRADETTVNNDGKTPAQVMLHLPANFGLRRFPEELKRALLLQSGSARQGMASPVLAHDARLSLLG